MSSGKEEVDVSAGEDVVQKIDDKSFFERLSDFIRVITSVSGFESNPQMTEFLSNLENYNKKKGSEKRHLENSFRDIFESFYEKHRHFILKGNFVFLKEVDDQITLPGNCTIPISLCYRALTDDNLDSFEACLFMILSEVCPADDIEEMASICEQFMVEEEETGGNSFMSMIGSVIGQVGDVLNGQDLELEKDGKINVQAVGGVVERLIGDRKIQDSIQGLLKGSSGSGAEDFDVNAVLENLMGLTKNPKGKKP